MPDQWVIKTLSFSGNQNWNTDACPHLNKVPMQLSVINAPLYFLLNDKTVTELNELCLHCTGFEGNCIE
jgi:hypothetical protein